MGRRQWPLARDWLEANGHIECDHDAREGVKAFCYLLGERWRASPLRNHEVNDHVSLAAWLEIRGKGEKSGPRTPDPVRDHLNRWLRRFTFDPAVLASGMAMVGDDERRMYAQMVIDLSRDPDERDGEYCPYGRFHSILTRMPRWMRSAIRIDGRPLDEVDIRATQPLVQAIHAAHHGTPPAPATTAPPTPDTIIYQICTHDLPDDLAEFFRDYPTVDFYRWVAPKFGMPCGTDEERSAVKKAWAWLVFADPEKAARIPEWRQRWDAYRAACPSVARWLQDAKRENYREAARACQRFEGRLMIQGVCGELMDRHPDLPILTIHDAILSPPDGIPIVCDAIRSAWATTGVVPALKVKSA
jgi:hypothetical protein